MTISLSTSNEYREMSNRLSTVDGVEVAEPLTDPKKVDHPAHTGQARVNTVTSISIDIHDPAITKTGRSKNTSNTLDTNDPTIIKTV